MSIEAAADRAFAPVREAIRQRRIPAPYWGWRTPPARGRCAGTARRRSSRAGSRSRATPCSTSRPLTKVVFTARRILDLAAEGRLALDAPLASAIPDLRQYDVAGAAERRLTFRQCLAHQTHLPAVEPLYTYGQDPQTLRAFVLQREWRAGPPVYSDINFILLGIAIERLTGAALADQPAPGPHLPPDTAAARRPSAAPGAGA